MWSGEVSVRMRWLCASSRRWTGVAIKLQSAGGKVDGGIDTAGSFNAAAMRGRCCCLRECRERTIMELQVGCVKTGYSLKLYQGGERLARGREA